MSSSIRKTASDCLSEPSTARQWFVKQTTRGDQARAKVKLTPANLVYNFDHLVFHERQFDKGGIRPK